MYRNPQIAILSCPRLGVVRTLYYYSMEGLVPPSQLRVGSTDNKDRTVF